jgi:hypothetical protein
MQLLGLVKNFGANLKMRMKTSQTKTHTKAKRDFADDIELPRLQQKIQF